MTIPGGMGSESTGSADRTYVADDEAKGNEPSGVPAAGPGSVEEVPPSDDEEASSPT